MTEKRATYEVPPSLGEVDAVFGALAHEARRYIVLLLGQLGGELPSGYLAARFQHSWPTTTRHLKVLEQAGIVEVRREGRNSHYRLDRERITRVVGGWLRHVAPVDPGLSWAPSGARSTRELAGSEAPAAAPASAPPRRARHTVSKRSQKKGTRP